MSLVLLLPPDGLDPLLLLEPLLAGVGDVGHGHGGEDVLHPGLLDVDQHVGVGAVPRGHHLLPLPTKVVVNSLLLGASRDHVVVKLAPFAVTFGIDKHNIMASVIVTTEIITFNEMCFHFGKFMNYNDYRSCKFSQYTPFRLRKNDINT